jgi:hypothetical protein
LSVYSELGEGRRQASAERRNVLAERITSLIMRHRFSRRSHLTPPTAETKCVVFKHVGFAFAVQIILSLIKYDGQTGMYNAYHLLKG